MLSKCFYFMETRAGTMMFDEWMDVFLYPSKTNKSLDHCYKRVWKTEQEANHIFSSHGVEGSCQ